MGILDIFRPSSVVRGGIPQPIVDAMNAQGMNAGTRLGPGVPLKPMAGYSQRPRAMDYPTGVNAVPQSRHAWGRTSYELLREMMRAYDVAAMCKNHKIDELRSMEPLLTPMDGFRGDGELAVSAARAVLAFPDRETPWDEWLALWLENLLTFDSGPLYKRRDNDGRIIGLEVIDGSTIYPLRDENGRRPLAPAPAYQQLIKGQVSTDLTAEDIIMTRFRPQTDSPFGMAPLESLMLTANTDLRFQQHLLELFTEGSIPGGLMEVPGDLSTPDQVAEWQDYWDATFMGDQTILHKMLAVPAGSKFTGIAPASFDPEFPKYLAIKIAGAFGVVPQDLGLTDDVNRATGETQTDTQFRVNTLPWVRFVESRITRYLQHDIGLPVQMRLNTGRDKEDRLQEAQAWKIYVDMGAASVDEMREELLGLATDNKRPIPRFYSTTRQGPVPLDSILAIAGKTDPETKGPAEDAILPYPFDGTPGLMPDKLPGGTDFKRAPQNPDDPRNPESEHPTGTGVVPNPAAAVTKDMTAGVTSATGIAGMDLVDNDDEDETPAPEDAKAELAKFKAFTKARAKQGKWRDFEFTTLPEPVAKHLNEQAREQLLKDDDRADVRPKAGTPNWRDDPPVLAAQHAVDLTLTDYWSPRIRDSLMELWQEADLRSAITATQGVGDAALGVFRQVARQVLSGAVQPSTLEQVVTNAWADAYNVGAMAAKVQMGSIPTGWDTWKPGMADVNQITALGWKEALADAGLTIKDITDTTVRRLAYKIADGVNAGDPSDVIAGALDEVLGDPARSVMIAQTETARMLTNASLAQYAAMGVKQWDLVVSAGACATVCIPEEANNPHSNDDRNRPPLHPYCRCAATPHIEGHAL